MTSRADNTLAGSPASRAGFREPKGASLGVRLDEAAAAVHTVALARLVLTLAGAVLGLMLLPIRATAAWLVCSLIVEAWSWFATRPPSALDVTARPRRAAFVASYAVQLLCWLALGGLLIASGAAAGQASGAALIMTLVAIAVLLFHSTPANFVLAGLLPASAAFSIIALRDGHGWRELAPIWIALGLGMIFTLGRAIETPSAQDSNRRLNHSLRQYQILAENVTDIICRNDLNGLAEYVSPAALDVLGYRPEELIGRPWIACWPTRTEARSSRRAHGTRTAIGSGCRPAPAWSSKTRFLSP
jgi:PAS domain-containing protein